MGQSNYSNIVKIGDSFWLLINDKMYHGKISGFLPMSLGRYPIVIADQEIIGLAFEQKLESWRAFVLTEDIWERMKVINLHFYE